MIDTQKLLDAVQNKVQIWQFCDIFATEIDAKRAGAKLFIENKGIQIKLTREKSYILLYWNI